MRKNPFIDIYKACNAGTTNREKNELRKQMDEPLLIDVELTNSCNLQCYMCPTGTNSMTRHKGFMAAEVMAQLIDNLRDSAVGGVRLILWGEPTLHPKFPQYVKSLKEIGKLVWHKLSC